MHEILEVIYNRALLAALTGWFLAQSIKIPLYYLVEKKWDWRRFFGSGGMPSSHSAMVVALAITVGVYDGFSTPEFAMAAALAMIVMYDASGVRRETGRQGQVINEILAKVLVDGKPISDSELKELVGHSPLEVAGGALVGILAATLWLVF